MENKALVKENLSEEDKRMRAAYALNMCTVSVSQIVDYQDLNVLEQEYEAILNNLNLEQIPKDPALLNILKQLLDTITYFRMDEGDKAIVEKEYQYKIKNAIWSAVPNFGTLIISNGPIGWAVTAISLISQVGTGYMNYRRNKAKFQMEHDKQLWQLQRNAIEQFNGLRRELFDTAWRLADAYQFPDEYRLTERQIKQYNQILLDPDPLRRLERLESVQHKFVCYPPFWYYMGHAAHAVATDQRFSDDTRQEQLYKALGCFQQYERVNRFNILREDQLASACALEHVDLLFELGEPSGEEVAKLVDNAVRFSGSAFDILQLCAFSYLKIGEVDKAAKLLKILVNEGYNQIINAQMLSSIYVRSLNRSAYETLSTRVDKKYLFPMPPKDNKNLKLLGDAFARQQREVLKDKLQFVFIGYLRKWSMEWNRVTSVFEPEKDYDETFFQNTLAALERRKEEATRIFASPRKTARYVEYLADSGYQLQLLDILNGFVEGLFTLSCLKGSGLRADMKRSVEDKLEDVRDDINWIQGSIDRKTLSESGYLKSQEISLGIIVSAGMKELLKSTLELVDSAGLESVSAMESGLNAFCMKQGISLPEFSVKESKPAAPRSAMFGPEIFGERAVNAQKKVERRKELVDYMKDETRKIILSKDRFSAFFPGDPDYAAYFKDTRFDKLDKLKRYTMMVIKSLDKKNCDLLFTTDKVVRSCDLEFWHTRYSKVILKNGALKLEGNYTYKTDGLDLSLLYMLCEELEERSARPYREGNVAVTQVQPVPEETAGLRDTDGFDPLDWL